MLGDTRAAEVPAGALLEDTLIRMIPVSDISALGEGGPRDSYHTAAAAGDGAGGHRDSPVYNQPCEPFSRYWFTASARLRQQVTQIQGMRSQFLPLTSRSWPTHL